MNKRSSIKKIFTGIHIDMSKVIAISDAFYGSNFSYVGHECVSSYWVEFTIYLEYGDPIVYKRHFEKEEYDIVGIKYMEDGETPFAVHRLQQEVDKLVEVWKLIKTES